MTEFFEVQSLQSGRNKQTDKQKTNFILSDCHNLIFAPS